MDSWDGFLQRLAFRVLVVSETLVANGGCAAMLEANPP